MMRKIISKIFRTKTKMQLDYGKLLNSITVAPSPNANGRIFPGQMLSTGPYHPPELIKLKESQEALVKYVSDLEKKIEELEKRIDRKEARANPLIGL